ncbi:MAG: glycosyltransferase family 4 protein [Verrucomicrobiales bacterium]
MPSLAIQFARFGPYHLARINAAVEALAKSDWNVVGLETAGSDETYAWREEKAEQAWNRHTVFPEKEWESIPSRTIRSEFTPVLDELQPDAIAIAGWGSPDARACLSWCKKNGAKAIAMSETREADGQRTWWKEIVKKRLVRQFDAGLVGAHSHRDYLVKLGLPAEAIQFGYNVVDNHYFTTEADRIRQEDASLNLRPYFLASNRFIERKNLDRLVLAYAEATSHTEFSAKAWDLCLLGDGPLMPQLKTQAANVGLTVAEVAPWETRHEDQGEPTVFFPGFRQIEELPRFHAHAGCFVHPALEEPWGLVINEAMACGVPILSSSYVGAAEELVIDSINGWQFDPSNVAEISMHLFRIASMTKNELSSLASESQRILLEKCPTSAFGKGLKAIISKIAPA